MKHRLALLLILIGCALALLVPANALQSSSSEQPAAQSTAPPVSEYHLPPDKMAKAEALYRTRTVLYVVGLLLDIVILLIIIYAHLAPHYRNWAERASSRRLVQALIFVPLLVLTMSILSIPLDIYGHHISRAYGLSVQGWGSWSWDWCKGILITCVVAIPATWCLYAIIRRSPRHWWFYFWLITLPFMVFIVFIAPVVLEPMFNKFEPLQQTNPQLVDALEKVVHRGGMTIPQSRMFLMRASEKVTTYNAYVTGIGATKRVVVWDNTAKDMTIPETMFVFGHEMGHYVLDHIYKGLAFAAVLLFVGFWLGQKLVVWAVSRSGTRWEIRALDDLASLPVLLLALSVLSLIGEPVSNAFSRHIEHQADVYGLEVIHGLVPNSSQVAAASFQKLGEKSYSYPNPNPVFVFWAYDHPPVSDRVQFALHYKPWETPQGPNYVK